jgi:hypothetical protein
MKRAASIIQLSGMATVTTGAWMYSQTAGIILSGVMLTLVGMALERSE